jgi:hypothetical protein
MVEGAEILRGPPRKARTNIQANNAYQVYQLAGIRGENGPQEFEKALQRWASHFGEIMPYKLTCYLLLPRIATTIS